jgi:class 3 adenylate cyclase/ketosteroid isomerase-like protein
MGAVRGHAGRAHRVNVADLDRSTHTPCMERSEELRSLVRRFADALRDGDEQAVSNRLSRLAGFERFGSDPAEWFRDGDEAVLVLQQQMREMGGGYPFGVVQDVDAHVEGSVGWASFQADFDDPTGGEPNRYRATLVLHLEHGDWKIVQTHSSVPHSNAEHGFMLTTSVDQIARSVSVSRPDLSGASAPDGTVTIAFTDIEDSTRLNDFLGDQRWLEILRAHNDVIKDVTADHGGTVVKNQGDGFMLAFASARRALHCAEAIERTIGDRFNDPGSVVRVRIGIHVGETVREADDFFGHAVSYAARIASRASGGEIVVSSLVHDLLVQTGEFTFDEPRVVELKGIAGTHRVYPVAVSVVGA